MFSAEDKSSNPLMSGSIDGFSIVIDLGNIKNTGGDF
jgi:hypothetical protein